MKIIINLFRVFLIAAFAMWFGGFGFYVSFVVPIGNEVLGSAFGQGRDQYFNVESIQSSPITTATISGQDYVLACNTPDNSLEVWAIDETGSPPVTFVSASRKNVTNSAWNLSVLAITASEPEK